MGLAGDSLTGGYPDTTQSYFRLETLAYLVGKMHELVTALGILESQRPDSPSGINSDVFGKIAPRAEHAPYAVCIHLALGKITAAERMQSPDRALGVNSPCHAVRSCGQLHSRGGCGKRSPLALRLNEPLDDAACIPYLRTDHPNS